MSLWAVPSVWQPAPEHVWHGVANLIHTPKKKKKSVNLDIFPYVIASSDLCSRVHVMVPESKLAETLAE